MKRLLWLFFCVGAIVPCSALVYERFEQGGKVGLRDEQGQVVIPASFDALGWSDGSFSLAGEITGYRKGTRWGLLNLKKEFVTKADYLTLTWNGGDRVRVSREVSPIAVKFGCIDLRGNLVIPFAYDDIVLYDLRAIVMIKAGVRYNYGLIDLENKSILSVNYKRIVPLGTLRYAVQDFENKTALCSEEGKWVTGFDIDSLSRFRNDLAILYQRFHCGVIDRSGSVRVDPVYRDIRILDDGSVQARKPTSWKIIDMKQAELHRLDADALERIAPNRSRVTISRKSGLVDSLFREILPVEYDYIGPVVNEKLVVGKQGKFGLIRTNRTMVLPMEFDSLLLEGHLVRARTTEAGKSSWHLYDTVGVRKTASAYDRIDPFNGRFLPVFRNGFAGAISRTGNEQIACVYDSLLEADDTRCAVRFKGLYGIIALNDSWILPPQQQRIELLPDHLHLERRGHLKVIVDSAGQVIYFTDNPLTVVRDHFLEKLADGTEKEINFRGQLIQRRAAERIADSVSAPEREGLILIRRDGKYGFVDNRGRLRIANRYEDAGDFHDGLAAVRLLGKWGFIDKSDQIVIQPVYDQRAQFENGTAIVVRAGRAGLINPGGNVLLELRYDSIHRLDPQSFLLFANGHQGLADARGKILLEPRFDSLQPAGEHHMIVGQAGRYGLLTRDGLSVFPVHYEHLVFLPETGTFFARQSHDWETITLK